MNKFLLSALFMAATAATCAAAMPADNAARAAKADTIVRVVPAPVDTLNYKVNYHWGFINKQAGSGQVTLQIDNDKVTDTDTLTASLKGASIPWFGRVYQVSDTLRAVMTRLNDQNPDIIHEHVIYENGVYTKPIVLSNADGKARIAPIRASRNIYGQGALQADSTTMEAVRVTADMLGAFYYARAIDWSRLNPGDTMVMPIEWSDVPEGCSATVTYRGRGTCQIEGKDYPTYQTILAYTFEGKPSGYDITCQIAQDTRVPLLLSADIAIGHVEMVYSPAPLTPRP